MLQQAYNFVFTDYLLWSVSYQQEDLAGWVPAKDFFWYDSDKDLKASFSMTLIRCMCSSAAEFVDEMSCV